MREYKLPDELKDTYLEKLIYTDNPYFNKNKIGSDLNSIQLNRYNIPKSNIDFSSNLKKFDIKNHPELIDVVVPIKFNWAVIDRNDDELIKSKKKLIALPTNQGSCGSCWSVAGSSIVGDNFVVSGLVDYKPNISATWALSCYSQQKCKGGNVSILFNDIAKSGISDDKCVNYEWCSTDKICKDRKNDNVDMSNLDSKIPSCKCVGNKNPTLYFIKSFPEFISVKPNLFGNDISQVIKQHIYVNGPVLGGLMIYENFMDGMFTKVNKGIYLENGVYDSDKIFFSNNQIKSSKNMGGHAVCILGWGEEPIIIDNEGQIENVPYWYCRNSWGREWGDNGYFKIAMYPWNKFSQLDKEIIDDEYGKVGGIILTKAKNIVVGDNNTTTQTINEQPITNVKRNFTIFLLIFLIILAIAITTV